MCGILGVIGTPQASRQVVMGLSLLQHRGQDAAGVLSYDESGFHCVKDLGLVQDVVRSEDLDSLTGDMALGHVRYGTTGRSEASSVQPFLMNYPYGLGLVHNGNLVNYRKLARDLQEEFRRHALTTSDSEAILNLFAEALSRKAMSHRLSFHSIASAVHEVMERAVGSYSIVTMIAGYGLVAFRDPHGIRPLMMAKRRETGADGKPSLSVLVSSESTVASFLDYGEMEEIQPGEVVFVALDGSIQRMRLVSQDYRPCMFEWVYFASPQSTLADSNVYAARIRLGQELAKQVQRQIAEGAIKPDVVVPVPETARIAAIALSEALGIPYREVLIKNRYISRTFILDSAWKREKAVQLKLSPVVSEIQGKNVLLVDDSIVRGTTSRKLVDVVRQSGAKEVYFVTTAPEVRYPCYYGIDFPVQEELIAFGKTVREIEQAIGVDRLIYQSLDSLERAILPPAAGADARAPGVKACVACLSGAYPTSVEDSQELTRKRREDRNEGAAPLVSGLG